MDHGWMLRDLLLYLSPFLLYCIIYYIKKAADRRELNQLMASGKAGRVKGIISGLKYRKKGLHSGTYDFEISYTVQDGTQLHTAVRSRLSKANKLAYIGTEVEVIYNPSRPKNAIAHVPAVPKRQLPTEEKLRERDDPRLQ